LTGFVGKLMVLEAARDSGAAVVTWSVLLVAALVVIVAIARAGSALFWRTSPEAAMAAVPAPARGAVTSVIGLLACLVGMVAWGGAATTYAADTARQLADPAGYVGAVLGTDDRDREHRRSLR
jgi:multicomponent K+:H+ antiporter subunit D